jgi:hypothetical protein
MHLQLNKEIEMRKFQVGDRVRNSSTGGYAGIKIGEAGTIIDLEGTSGYMVEFPFNWPATEFEDAFDGLKTYFWFENELELE